MTFEEISSQRCCESLSLGLKTNRLAFVPYCVQEPDDKRLEPYIVPEVDHVNWERE